MNQVRDLARRYWFDVLVAVLAIAAMLEVVLGRRSPGAPDATLWFCVPAIATLVLPAFARQRFRLRARRCTGRWRPGFRSSTRC